MNRLFNTTEALLGLCFMLLISGCKAVKDRDGIDCEGTTGEGARLGCTTGEASTGERTTEETTTTGQGAAETTGTTG